MRKWDRVMKQNQIDELKIAFKVIGRQSVPDSLIKDVRKALLLAICVNWNDGMNSLSEILKGYDPEITESEIGTVVDFCLG